MYEFRQESIADRDGALTVRTGHEEHVMAEHEVGWFEQLW